MVHVGCNFVSKVWFMSGVILSVMYGSCWVVVHVMCNFVYKVWFMLGVILSWFMSGVILSVRCG